MSQRSLGKIDAVAVIGHVTVLFMADHFGNTSHIKADAGCAACHRLDDGVGQVVL